MGHTSSLHAKGFDGSFLPRYHVCWTIDFLHSLADKAPWRPSKCFSAFSYDCGNGRFNLELLYLFSEGLIGGQKLFLFVEAGVTLQYQFTTWHSCNTSEKASSLK